MRNFAFPYFSRDIAEFWRRWHISLSTWFRDYLYIPLGGSRGGLMMKVRNTFIIFIVSGFWHGANWTFIVWGALNAIYFLPLLLTNKNRNNLEIVAHSSSLPSIRELLNMLITFGLTAFAWIFFRANSLEHAVQYIGNMFKDLGSFLLISTYAQYQEILILLFIFLIVEWIGRKQQHALAEIGRNWNSLLRYGMYYIIIFSIFWFAGKEQEFIYFQF